MLVDRTPEGCFDARFTADDLNSIMNGLDCLVAENGIPSPPLYGPVRREDVEVFKRSVSRRLVTNTLPDEPGHDIRFAPPLTRPELLIVAAAMANRVAYAGFALGSDALHGETHLMPLTFLNLSSVVNALAQIVPHLRPTVRQG